MEFSPVRNVIFDLGGVLYDIDIDSTVAAYQRLVKPGGPKIDFGKTTQHEFFSQLDRGEIEIEAFADGLIQAYELEADRDTVIQIWLDLLVGVFPGRDAAITRLAPHYRLVLLSNTSRFHRDAFQEACAGMFAQMEHLFLSYEMGLRKPDPAIYHRTLKEMGWKAEETLFVDDSKTNIDAAAALGIQVFWLEKPELFTPLMSRLLS